MIEQKVYVRQGNDQDHIILVAMTDDCRRIESNVVMRLFVLPARKNGGAALSKPPRR